MAARALPADLSLNGGLASHAAHCGATRPGAADGADRYAAHVPDVDWRRRSRDALIAGHVGVGDSLWTTTPQDFVALGVPEAAIVAVP